MPCQPIILTGYPGVGMRLEIGENGSEVVFQTALRICDLLNSLMIELSEFFAPQW